MTETFLEVGKWYEFESHSSIFRGQILMIGNDEILIRAENREIILNKNLIESFTRIRSRKQNETT